MLENRKFIKDNLAIIVSEPVFIMLILFLSYIYETQKEYIFYVVAFAAIVWLLTLIFQYNNFKKNKDKYVLKAQTINQLEIEKEEIKWQLVREREDFFAMWAHQVKTPIAAMNLLLQSEEQNVSACKLELFKIENYVEMALNYLRFDSIGNDLALVKCDLNEMTKQVVKKFSITFIHKHLSVKLESLEKNILTDEKWFMFVMEQIVSNALKYTNEGGLTISACEEEGKVFVQIKDTGIGIKQEDIPRIFEKGFTGYNGRMDKKASGLGLYLCKGVCDKLGHGIKVESNNDEGTIVTITVYNENVKIADLTKM